MRLRTLATLVGALALTFATAGFAQDDTAPSDAAPETSVPFVDADGDGINDIAARFHMQQGMRGRGSAFQETKRAQFTELFGQLSDEQQAEVQALVEQLRGEGLSPAEIHSAVGEKFSELGLDLPDTWNMTPAEFAEANRLTDAERNEIHTMVEEMRGEGATREQIRSAVAAKFEEYGKVMTRGPAMAPPRGQMPGTFGGDLLTEEQRSEIQTLMETLREEGATPSEIRDAVNAKFTEWGVEMPERPMPPPRRHGQR